MLVSNEINPSNSVYYIGGLILGVLEQKTSPTFDFLDLYQEINKSKKVSLQLFLYSMDWLYLLKKIEINSKGYLRKCF